MKQSAFAFASLLAFSTLVPTVASATSSPPNCAGLAAHFSTSPTTTISITSAIVPATPANPGIPPFVPPSPAIPSYCQVNLTDYHAINIRVGLPLSAVDGGTGGVQGAWNGKVQNLGGGGFAGNVGNVGIPIVTGYVGSSTDTGHSAAWCNAINPATGQPNSQPNCGLGGGGFVLDPNNQLIKYQVTDFIKDSLIDQVRWSLRLAKHYYGKEAKRNYWNGCSTGGRQGMEMAQSFGKMFDGILAGAPAMNWNRFQIGELWPPVVVKDIVGPGGLSPAKYNAANAAAIAACDGNDGVVDGLVNEPRRCNYNANARLCSVIPGDPNCLTPQEATAINAIWDGPRNSHGKRLWGGITPGTSFGILINANINGPVADTIGFITTYVQNWMHQNPNFDWHTITMANFASEFNLSDSKFEETASTDSTDLDDFRRGGGKMIHYHGLSDPLIVPFTSHNYVSRVFEKYGVEDTQKFMRSFFYPGNGHCGGGAAPLINGTDLFAALVNWVEHGVAPNYIVATQTAPVARTRKICKYPDEAVYKGAGSTDLEANFKCVVNRKEPKDLEAHSDTARRPHHHHHAHHDD